MKYEFHPEAEVDFVETVLDYETEALGLGGRFAAEVERAIEHLLKHPKIGVPDDPHPTWPRGTRRAGGTHCSRAPGGVNVESVRTSLAVAA